MVTLKVIGLIRYQALKLFLKGVPHTLNRWPHLSRNAMNLVPASLVSKRWDQTLSDLEYGVLHFVAPNGDVRTHTGRRPGPEAHFAIYEWEVLRRAAVGGDIALGEDYIDGAWDTDDLQALFALFLLNIEQLDGYAHGSLINRLGFVLQNSLLRRNSVRGSSRNIRAHYDVGNDFYRLWLDDTMTYSSALYATAQLSLEEAQRRKYGRILSLFNKPRASVLEIGCGWGGFAEQAVAASHDVTALTISPSQHRFASKRLGKAADIRLEDYRKSRGLYDMIVSIEMFEAVGEHYWPRFFETVSQRLRRGGRAIIQTITIRDELFEGYRTRSDFIRHHVFPGGMLPSFRRFREEAEHAGLKALSVFSFGQDYAETLRQWTARLEVRQADVKALGYGEAFLRNWKFYFGICAASFAVERTNVVQIELAHG